MNLKKAKYFFLLSVVCVQAFAQYTESSWDERDEWMDVHSLFEMVNLTEGAVVADIGCHEGYLSMHLAKKVGTTGLVYAVDVRADRLARLREHAEERNHRNIRTVHGDYNDPKLPEKALDVVFVIDTYHEMDEYETILEHIKASLKPGGSVLILEKLKDHAKGKSRSQQTASHTLAPKYVRKELKEAGFIIEKEARNLGLWENEPSKKIWVLVARVPEA